MKFRHIFTILFILALLFAGCGIVSASSPNIEAAIDKGLDYLSTRINTDGGMMEPNMQTSSVSSSWFSTTAIVSAGEDPLSGRWAKYGKNALDYLANSDSKSDGTGEIAKWITYVVACGEDPYTFDNYNAVQALKDKIKADGRGGDYVYTTYWVIFGLVAAGEDASEQVAWLKKQQHADGGFGSYGGEFNDPSDPDNTAASIMALRAAGVPATDPVITKAVQYLKDDIEENGGYNYGYYSSPNLASTAWVIQAFCSVGIDPSTIKSSAGNSPVDYLLSLQKEDGSFKYTETLTDSPVSMTGRAVAALTGKSYPILPDSVGYSIAGGAVATPTPTQTQTTVQTQTPSDNWTPRTITDDYGNKVTLSTKPQRIISLAPANTEILFAVGAGDRVIAVTEYCTYPEEATKLPIIGGYSTVNIERVVSLNPDLIFAYSGNGEDTVSYLKNLGYTIITLNADSIDGTLQDIKIVGQVVGCEEEAEALIKDMEKRLDAVAEKVSDISESEKPTIVHCMWTDPLWLSGSNTFQDEMIEFAGGINAAESVNGWGVLTLEKFLLIDPDIIIVDTGMGMGEGAEDVLKNYFFNEPRLKNLKAVQNNQVYAVNADIIDRGGPRIVDGIETIASIAYPEIFGEYGGPDSSSASSPGFGIILTFAAVACGLFWIRRD